MDIQTEKLENHTARFTVNVGVDRFEKAKQQAAKKLSKRYNIPGFRKGKAPYRVIASYLGEAPIIEDAMETLGNDIYKKALDESDIQPYGPGSLEDFQLDPSPTYIFTVPLQPEVELSDYRSIRMDFEKPEVTDEQVDSVFKGFQQEHALVEESSQPAVLGNRLTVDIHGAFADDATSEESEDTKEDSDADDTNHEPAQGEMFIHRHDFEVTLDPENERIIAGFSEALVGAEAESNVEFELEVPDEESFEGIVGRKVKFDVHVHNVDVVTLPEINDDLAARVTEDEDEQLTLLQLRMRIRENLEEDAEQTAQDEYASKILAKVVEESTIIYPEMMVDDQVEDLLNELDQNLRQQGMTLDDYTKVTGTSRETLAEQNRERAIEQLERSLVLGELLVQEKISVEESDIDVRVDEVLAQFGEQAASLRQLFDTPQMRSNLVNELMYQKLIDRLAKIGRGEEIEQEVETTAEESQSDEVEATPVVETVAEDVQSAEKNEDDS